MVWTDHSKDLLRHNWASSSAQELSDLLGVSITSIENMARSLDLPKKSKPTKWSEEQIALAIRRANEGWTALEIAEEIGTVSRGAVIGFLSRRGIKLNNNLKQKRQNAAWKGAEKHRGRTYVYKPRIKKLKPPTTKKPRKNDFQFGMKKSVNKGRVQPTPPPVMDMVVGDTAVPLLERRGNQCSYLVGHHLCCGAPTHSSSSWCDHHYNRVFYIPDKRRVA